jgi:hypothetical protein
MHASVLQVRNEVRKKWTTRGNGNSRAERIKQEKTGCVKALRLEKRPEPEVWLPVLRAAANSW